MEKTIMSSLNGFSVSVPQALEETTEGHVVMKHGQTFSVRLHNGHKTDGYCKPADAELWIQGRHVGNFRVPAGQTVIIEHPANDYGKFTAYKNDSQEAIQIGLDTTNNDNGLIKVVWKPGTLPCKVPVYVEPEINWWPAIYSTIYSKEYEYDNVGWHYNTTTTYKTCLHNNTRNSCCPGKLIGGGVGLSGNSDQEFSEISSLMYDEPENVIYLRIAFREDDPRPISSSKVWKVQSTKVPRRLQ